MSTTNLKGLRSQPLSSYLAAVGLLRVLSEQRDSSITGCWNIDAFQVDGIDSEEIVEFLINDFVPSPVFSPWNKEGDPSQNKRTAEQLRELRNSGEERFDGYVAVLDAYDRSSNSGWASFDKAARLTWWRANAPDEALAWTDAAFVLGVDDDPKFPPLLGTGGNDGRFEFSRLLHGELIRLFINPKTSAMASGWLRSFLFSEPGPPLVESTLGAYNSDASGTPNSSASGSAKSASNPWEIVLAFEGLLALAGSVASRLGSGRARTMSAPFMVRSSMVDDGEVATEDSRGELWAPLWSRPVRWSELRHLLGEGRMEWNGNQARSTVDAARAVASLGTDRGLDGFERFNLMKRNGLAFVAVPVGRANARSTPGIHLLSQIDPWVSQVRRFSAKSVGISLAMREVDRAQMRVVSQRGAPSAYLDVLIALAALERAIGANAAARSDSSPFPSKVRGRPALAASDWLEQIGGSGEAYADPALRLAVGLASLRDSRGTSEFDQPYPLMALALRGLSARKSADNREALAWSQDSHGRDVAALAASRAGEQVLAEVLTRRLREADEVLPASSVDSSSVIRASYSNGTWVSLSAVSSLFNGTVDPLHVLHTARGLSMLDDWTEVRLPGESTREVPTVVEPWFAAVRLCLLDRRSVIEVPTESGSRQLAMPLAPRSWGRLITAGRLDDVGQEAGRRLRRAGHPAPRSSIPPDGTTQIAVLIALLVRLSNFDLGTLSRSLIPTYMSSTHSSS